MYELRERIGGEHTVGGGEQRWLFGAEVTVAVGATYFLAAQLGLTLLTAAERVAVFWPASGIAVGVLIALGAWARVPVAAGVVAATFAANLMGDRSVWSALAFGLCNAGEVLLATWLIERRFGPAFNLDSLRRVLGFFAAAIIATATAAVGASGAMKLFGPSTAEFLDVWEVWFASDALGIITVAPLLIGVAAAMRNVPPWRELLEGSVAIVFVTTLIGFLLFILSGPWSLVAPASFLFPPLLWLGYRCRPVFAAAAVFTIATAIVCATTYELGRFGDATQPTAIRAIAAQVAILGTTLAGLSLAALFAERRRHEATMVAILDAANVIAWDVDLIRNAVHTTGPVGRLLDRPEGSKPRDCGEFVECIHTEDRDRVMAQFWTAVGTGVAYQLEFRLHTSGGNVRWVTAEGSIERDTHGRPVRMRGITRDITARKHAEEGLQESERKLRELLGALPAAVHTTDTAGRITYCNKAAVDLWGVSPELGKDKCSDLGRLYYPDGTLIPVDLCPTKLCLMERRALQGREALFERPDGRRIPIIPYPAPLTNEQGEVVGVVSMKLDISERKKAELALAERNIQLGLAGKAALVGSFAYGTDTEIMQISEGYAAIHGFPEGIAEKARSECLAGVHREDIGRVTQLRSEAFRARRREYKVEYRIIRPGGEVRWVETRCFISYDGEGRPHRVVGVSIDMTERKRVEEQQRTLVAELDHRVKNVLATVSAIVAQTQNTGSSHSEFVSALDSRIKSLARTHELLSQSRWSGVSLAEIARREFAPYAADKVECSGPSVTLRAEAAQAMAMVLHELTTNAAKYGAFSDLNGRVSLRWRWLQNGSHGRLAIEWQEIGGPPVLPPSQSSYGTAIIRELIPFELGGTTELAFASDGIRCRIELPAEWVKGSTAASNKAKELVPAQA